MSVKIPLCIVVLAIAAQSTFHSIQYHYGSIHYAWMTKEAYFDSFWRMRPSKEFKSLLSPKSAPVKDTKKEEKKS
jgi:hypothetical protein